ncbi:hypothetical protein [Oscillatoria sp. FACHB-1407]|uniref:hypothetical protein n=1 Tax=Oscillatoria sp. FACHB-1407 TaxID=2692847 RepID=UPI001686D211|nr:hypothetical protein [Oscillatoria sp. FACHB-1407]
MLHLQWIDSFGEALFSPSKLHCYCHTTTKLSTTRAFVELAVVRSQLDIMGLPFYTSRLGRDAGNYLFLLKQKFLNGFRTSEWLEFHLNFIFLYLAKNILLSVAQITKKDFILILFLSATITTCKQ